MDIIRLRFFLEVLGIATGIVLFVCVLPIQLFIEKEIRILTVLFGAALWYVIIYHNETFRLLVEKWFKR